MDHDVVSPPSINIDNATLDAVDSFTYLGFTVDSNRSLDVEINVRLGNDAVVMSKLNRRV